MMSSALLVMTQLAVIFVVARVASMLARAVRQSPAVGEILAGLCLGPCVLGLLAPSVFGALFPADGRFVLTLLSQAGLLMLMFQIGCEFDFSLLKDSALRRSVGVIAAASLSLPFAAGALFAYTAHPVLAPNTPLAGFTLMLGVAFAITALPILGRILMELRMERSRIGVLGITAAAINDLFGWLALLGFGVFSKAASVLGIFGGFSLGLMASSARGFTNWWHRHVAPWVERFLLPVFFTYTGLRIQALSLDKATLGWCAGLIALAMLAKVVAGYFSARRLGLSTPESKAIAVMMNTRGLMELVIANVGLDLGLFPPAVFGTLVLMALISTAITTPALRALMPKIYPAAVMTDTRPLAKRRIPWWTSNS